MVLGEIHPSASHGENFDENPLPNRPFRVTLYSRRRSSSQMYCWTRFSPAVSPPLKGNTDLGSISGAGPRPSSSVVGTSIDQVARSPSLPVGKGRSVLGAGMGGKVWHDFPTVLMNYAR